MAIQVLLNPGNYPLIVFLAKNGHNFIPSTIFMNDPFLRGKGTKDYFPGGSSKTSPAKLFFRNGEERLEGMV